MVNSSLRFIGKTREKAVNKKNYGKVTAFNSTQDKHIHYNQSTLKKYNEKRKKSKYTKIA